MFYVYVLKSKRNDKRYVGFTRNNPQVRLEQHNHKKSSVWTRQNGPFELIFSEIFKKKQQAMQRENFLKSGDGRRFLDNFIPK